MGLNENPDTTLLGETRIAFFVLERTGWSVTDGCLRKSFEFPSFADAVEFIDRVAVVADSVNHHPDLELRGTTVTLALTSHDAGGLTTRDTHLATLIEEVADTWRPPVGSMVDRPPGT